MIGFCADCVDPGREGCKRLCKEAKLWADQDKVYRDSHERITKSGEPWEFDLHSTDAERNGLTFAEYFGGTPYLGLLEWRIVKKLGLTEQQLQCMWLYHWDLKCQEEIAKKLGITQQTVAEHLKMAEAKLYDELKFRGERLKKIEEADLTSRQREIAELYYKFDTSQAKIGKKLGITEPTVNEHLKKIRKIANLEK